MKSWLLILYISYLVCFTHSEENEEEKQESGGVNVIEYGKICNKNYPEACKNYPNVECVKNSRGISTCRCNFLKTWNTIQQKCIVNVFAPCSSPDSGNENDDLPCGENMNCILDTLGIKNIKFCRCKKGFKPTDNKENIPAFCVPDPNYEDLDELENLEDYEHGSSSKLGMISLLNFILILIAHYLFIQ